MDNIEKLIINSIKFEEGERLKVYRCSEGFLTVGVGHNLQADPARLLFIRELKFGDKITQEESDKLFEFDYNLVKYKRLDIPGYSNMRGCYQLVLSNMIFQMGINRVLKFNNTLRFMREDKPDVVITHMKASKWYRQTPARVVRLCRVINLDIPREYL